MAPATCQTSRVVDDVVTRWVGLAQTSGHPRVHEGLILVHGHHAVVVAADHEVGCVRVRHDGGEEQDHLAAFADGCATLADGVTEPEGDT
jgi:hypothetical protein